jgi:hypothetical protein
MIPSIAAILKNALSPCPVISEISLHSIVLRIISADVLTYTSESTRTAGTSSPIPITKEAILLATMSTVNRNIYHPSASNCRSNETNFEDLQAANYTKPKNVLSVYVDIDDSNPDNGHSR